MLVNIYISSADKYTKTFDSYHDFFVKKSKEAKNNTEKVCT